METHKGNHYVLFQFTPLREGRHDYVIRDGIMLAISIHAPPRGATQLQPVQGEGWHISIHAPPRGATSFAALSAAAFSISIHAPPRGATHQPGRSGG